MNPKWSSIRRRTFLLATGIVLAVTVVIVAAGVLILFPGLSYVPGTEQLTLSAATPSALNAQLDGSLIRATDLSQAWLRIGVFTLVALAAIAGGLYLATRRLNRETTQRLEEMAVSIHRINSIRFNTETPTIPMSGMLRGAAGDLDEAIFSVDSALQSLRESQERLAGGDLADPLTHLPNRAAFTRRLDQALELLAGERVSQVAVLFLDLDGFKLINESYDHGLGDRILVNAAQRIRAALRGDDYVARLGGDEFGVLLEDLRTQEEAVRVAQRILADIRRPYEINNGQLFLTCSIGIASTVQDQNPRGEELLRNADMAMYTAKARGKNDYAIFDAQMHNEAVDRLTLETDLRKGIDRDEFLVYYQPIVSMFDGRITSLEALIRWRHPERGILLPEVFLDAVRNTGLMMEMNKALFHKAFGQLAAWRAHGLTDLRLAVNVSALSLTEESFWEVFEDELTRADVPASAIQVEVVESEMASSLDLTMEALERLRGMGVTISVDDFGTGYSSLAYLKRLPIHCLKIDRTFIKDVLHDRDDAAIVSAMIVMAHTLDLDVVAEGVETAGQFRFLLDQSCEKAQGFLMSQPMPAEEVMDMLARRLSLLPEEGTD